ncbi:MAG TPA: carbohydrate ABC transporter permease [Paenirhodobacter sp.]
MIRRGAVHGAALILVLIWTVPVLGLVITSFRDRAQILETGWWQIAAENRAVRAMRLDPGRGDLLVPGERLIGWGIAARAPAAFPPGAVADLPRGQLTVDAQGHYRLDVPGPPTRVFVTVASRPQLTLANYRQVLGDPGVWAALGHTLVVTIPAVVLPVLLAAFAAYALVFLPVPGRAVLIAVIVGLLAVPLQLTLIPVLRIYTALGIGHSYIGIWLAHTAFGLPVAIWLLRNAMQAVPHASIAAARIDGAAEFTIFRRIALPLSLPAIAALSIFQFLWVWNDLLLATVFLGSTPDRQVLTGLLRDLLGSHGGAWQVLTASAVVSIIVPVVVFFGLQRALIRGLMAGTAED